MLTLGGRVIVTGTTPANSKPCVIEPGIPECSHETDLPEGFPPIGITFDTAVVRFGRQFPLANKPVLTVLTDVARSVQHWS